MVDVRLDAMLKQFIPKSTVSSHAGSVEALLTELETGYPRLKFRLRDETGAIRRFIRVFVNGEDISVLGGQATQLGQDDQVDILHSIAGG